MALRLPTGIIKCVHDPQCGLGYRERYVTRYRSDLSRHDERAEAALGLALGASHFRARARAKNLPRCRMEKTLMPPPARGAPLGIRGRRLRRD